MDENSDIRMSKQEQGDMISMKAKIQILCWLMSVILSSIQAFAGEIWYLKTADNNDV